MLFSRRRVKYSLFLKKTSKTVLNTFQLTRSTALNIHNNILDRKQKQSINIDATKHQCQELGKQMLILK